MGHNNDRWNIEFRVMVKDLTVEQILKLLAEDLNLFDENVLRSELHWRAADADEREAKAHETKINFDERMADKSHPLWDKIIEAYHKAEKAERPRKPPPEWAA
ncbi:MAG: hypothetical protein WAV38_26615 [Xanthobacteraceae bacterium]